MTETESYLNHVMTFEEVGWGVALIAVTMIIHAIGMLATLTIGDALQKRSPIAGGFFVGLRTLVVVSWIIVVVHLSEVVVWAGFLVWHDAMPTASAAYYYSLMQYVTVGSELTLPVRWRLLGGMIGMAGLLTFAWSTTVLLTLAQRFQDRQLRHIAQRSAGGPGTGTAQD
jgi:voltage-gated potassium channel